MGIDLGTTNTAIAVFDGAQVQLLPNAEGELLTASAVFIDETGLAQCGAVAQRALGEQAHNVCAEHKRLLGQAPNGASTRQELGAKSLSPEELAAVVLRSAAADFERRYGHAMRSAVISIPAAFGLPQTRATADAAALAGIEHVELVQEPIAAALAAGWEASAHAGHWLVYDLGGGTFDVSLLEAEGDFLRVVDHAGDPFLGGRDIDAAIARWACQQVGLTPTQLSPDAWAGLRFAAQGAKLDLEAHIADTSGTSTTLSLAALPADARARFEAGLPFSAQQLASLMRPFVERSASLVRRLLAKHELSAAQLGRVLLVGGPTQSPALQAQLRECLGVDVHPTASPMLAVARGAALFAAANGVAATPPPDISQDTSQAKSQAPVATLRSGAPELWLHHPPISADLRPDLVGRYAGNGKAPQLVIATRSDGTRFEAKLDHEGAFTLGLELERNRVTRFELHCADDAGATQPASPSHIEIMHGLTIDEPPLGNSVGVALADNRVQVYFERGTPLPARRSFVHRTVEHLSGARSLALKIPIVQGEYDRAHLCQPVGFLELAIEREGGRMPAGSEIEVIIELDRSGRLQARARLPGGMGTREQVAHLLVPAAAPEALAQGSARLRARVDELKQAAFRARDGDALADLNALAARIDEVVALQAEAELDADTAHRATRLALELEAELETFVDAKHLDELETQALATMTWANTWVSLRGSPRERTMLEELAVSIDATRERGEGVELQRLTRLVAQLGESAWLRDPRSWGMLFESICADVDRATDLPRAHALVDRGREALSKEDWGGVRSIVERLRPLLPARAATRRMAHGSGVR